ncbi:hypothetical protein [Aequorivita capsosiphonis]|uniref:hypothetical protein n=1 Tax=Aequorivita capsosiphonis TaxID=487317 RepID=UPI00040FF6DB|nr:hypothetical protein [Aequorivita capsosiphonis]
MIRFLLISFLSIFVLTSCSLKTTEGLREVHFNKTLVENSYFSNAEIDYVYKAKIEVYKRNLGGILIIKKIGPESHRIVFTTEFGSKLFDFQFDGDVFTKNFVVEDLDKKFIINILRDDFKLLVNESAKVLTAYQNKNQRIYKTQSGNRYNFYFVDDTSEKLVKIINTSKTKEKVEIAFTSSIAEIADTIVIKHNNIKLTIDLEKFKND